MSAPRALAVALALLSFSVVDARAQAASPSATADAIAPSGPTLDAATIGVRPLATGPMEIQDTRPNRSRPVALMLVGAGGLIVGAIVDDEAGTIISVAGAVVLLYGLYRFLQYP